MEKTTFMRRKGQVTIFIITALLVFMVFIMILMMVFSAQNQQLEASKEKAQLKSLQKESVRLFVENCLDKSLEKGLRLLGEQGGAIWADQGGRKIYDDKKGFYFGDKRVAYAITYSEGDFLSYPCGKGVECTYTYPENEPVIYYGNNVLKIRSMEQDLEAYLQSESSLCLTDLLHSQVSEAAELQPSDSRIDLDIRDNGIVVEVNYPLAYKVNGEDYLFLSEFDFVYDTQFKPLIDAAAITPLNYDWQYVDFDYQKYAEQDGLMSYGAKNDVVALPGWECNSVVSSGVYDPPQKCSKVNVDYQKLNIEATHADSDDNSYDLIDFQPDWNDRLGNYLFRVARQNRPPALYCSDSNFGFHDPDEDVLVPPVPSIIDGNFVVNDGNKESSIDCP